MSPCVIYDWERVRIVSADRENKWQHEVEFKGLICLKRRMRDGVTVVFLSWQL